MKIENVLGLFKKASNDDLVNVLRQYEEFSLFNTDLIDALNVITAEISQDPLMHSEETGNGKYLEKLIDQIDTLKDALNAVADTLRFIKEDIDEII